MFPITRRLTDIGQMITESAAPDGVVCGHGHSSPSMAAMLIVDLQRSGLAKIKFVLWKHIRPTAWAY